MDLLSLVARLTLDSSDYDRGVNDAARSGKGLASSLEKTFGKIKKIAAGALSVAAFKKGIDTLTDLANSTAAYGDKIDKQSQALNLSRKAYQEWDYILSQSGASIDSMATSMKTLNNLVLDAAEGGENSKDAFAELGLGIHEIEELSPEQQFEEVVRAFQKMPASAKKSALAVQMFGKNGMQLLPLLNSSADSIDELREKAAELGIIMSDDAVNASVEYTDALDTMNRTFSAIKYSMGSKILPVFTKGMEKITAFAGRINKAFQENGLKGVWDMLVEDFKNIKWPSWSDISTAVTTAWNTIVEGVKALPGLVFGTKADGSVDWPTWDDVKATAETIWTGIKTGAKGLAGLVFGTKSDGSVDWPTWDDVEETAKSIWDTIKTNALGLAGLVFGKKEDGSVDWPTWEDVKAGAEAVWEAIKNGAKKLSGLVFGTKEDGSVDWPDIGALLDSFNTWWNDTARPALESAIVWTLTLFGMPTETAEDIAKVLGDWWNTIVSTAESVLNWALDLPDSPHEAGEALGKIISAWWSGIVSYAEGVLNWALGLFGIGDSDGTKTLGLISSWWETYIVPFIGGILNFTLGLFGLPSVEQMKNAIKAWWEQVKKDLVLTFSIFPRIADGSGSFQGGEPSGPTWGDSDFTKSVEVPGWNARGLDYVPYDGYLTRLHRGEQVLTASQARRYKSGGDSVSANSVSSMVADAIRDAMQNVTVRSYLNSRDVTDDVNRNTMREVKARRFAT